MMIRFCLVFLLSFACALVFGSGADSAPKSGEKIYTETCASCHGPKGEGVAGKYDEALYGDRSLEALAKYIDRRMPEDDPKKCRGEEAHRVAEYIFNEFYSTEARTRNTPPRIELARLTVRQYRESVADLVDYFSRNRFPSKFGGLHGEYFESDGMNKKAKRAFTREDTSIRFDFADGSPGENIRADQFSIAWQGSLVAPDTGVYELRLRTPNGARLYLNSELRPGDANQRDDSDAARHSAALDLWVSSGQMREGTTRVYLLGGRAYPLRLDFFKFKDAQASIHLQWKPPHGVWSDIPADKLSPEISKPVAIVTTAFPADDSSLGYERGTSVSTAWQEAITKAAAEAAGQIVPRVASLGGPGDKAPERAERLKDFAAEFVAVAFRRPLEAEQREFFVERHFSAAATAEIALRRVVILALCSPHFLYPELEGGADDYTTASRLAMTLWDSLPDRSLREAARKGELREAVKLRAQAARMMDHPRARAKLRDFFQHWLMMDEADDISKDTKVYPGFDGAFVADLRESLDRFVDHVVWGTNSDYRELLTSEGLFLNQKLAGFYGAQLTNSSGFAQVVLDSPRAGILSHPYLLSVLAYHRSSSPIHRGVFLTRNVLGRFLKPPPMAISFMDDRFDPSLTMREKVTELTKSENCMGCHITINPLGFSLENYDAAGRWRTEDNRKSVDAESDYLTASGQTLRLRGVRDVAQHAAESREARLGFIRNLFHHAVKQTPGAYGPDTLEHLDSFFMSSNHHIRNLLTEIAVRTLSKGSQANSQASR